MNDVKQDKKAVEVRLVTAQARKLETKSSLSRPNPYTTDWTDMSDLTRRALELHQSKGSKS